MSATDDILDEVVRRIADQVHPRRVILFGSAARGQQHRDSDFDLLVVMPDGTHRRRTAQYLYAHLGSDRPPVDLVVATETDIELHGDTPGYIYRAALREGKELHAA
ncbi:MAG: nucleotidyltransferase domain-containing protein [Actinobacteria bacterium]|nr:nucleotidyltransferase domain-containing protein [Actinomycetota bacterium]